MTAPSDDDSATKAPMAPMALARRFRSRLRELDESCRRLQLSNSAEAAASPPLGDAPEAELLQ
jgi:hypothetical protein